MTTRLSPTTAPSAAAARSFLFVPGDRPDRFDKAWASAADEVILDLEDAVGVERKVHARADVSAWLNPSRPVFVRINAVETAWYEDDLELLTNPGVLGLMVPKAEVLDSGLVSACATHGKRLLPIVETAVGFQRASELATTRCVERLAFGTLDFQVDMGLTGDDDALLYFRSRLVLESRLAGIQAPVDGVTPAIGDIAVLSADTARSKRIGFGGKLCIHPSQLDEVNRCFAPSPDDIKWAEEVVQAIANSHGAAIAIAGKMVDRPVILKAERILGSARRLSRVR
ncbi:CoA ester lyase [Variovorax sp. V213]|uniref:HpcH/HpaI aldolase/citrate lyase family protein n=1 Tax=Variovorax sp. V213 TaxID=3065955 RepID=UPI0034E84320